MVCTRSGFNTSHTPHIHYKAQLRPAIKAKVKTVKLNKKKNKKTPIIGYKAFYNDWTAHGGFQYEVGKTYTMEGKPEVCVQGFHYCPFPISVDGYYQNNSIIKYAEVEILGDVVTLGDKCATNKIHIKREITREELMELSTGVVIIQKSKIVYNPRSHLIIREHYKKGKLHREDGYEIEGSCDSFCRYRLDGKQYIDEHSYRDELRNRCIENHWTKEYDERNKPVIF